MRITEGDLALLEEEVRLLVPPVADAKRFRDDVLALAERLIEISASGEATMRLFLAPSERWLLLRATKSVGRGASTALDVLHIQLRSALAA